MEEPSAIRTEFARTTQPADDEFISRQSTMEERVIDRYVIETHPEEDGGEQHTEEQEAGEQEAEEEPVTTSVSYDVSGDEQQFRQALAGGLDEFRTELINRTLEHDASASGNDPAVLQTGTRPRKLTNATLAIISEPSKMRMSSSKTPPPSPLEADADETQGESLNPLAPPPPTSNHPYFNIQITHQIQPDRKKPMNRKPLLHNGRSQQQQQQQRCRHCHLPVTPSTTHSFQCTTPPLIIPIPQC